MTLSFTLFSLDCLQTTEEASFVFTTCFPHIVDRNSGHNQCTTALKSIELHGTKCAALNLDGIDLNKALAVVFEALIT